MDRIENRTWDELRIRDTASLAHRQTYPEVQLFAAVSQEMNPVCADAALLNSDDFQNLVAQGIRGGALFATLLGTEVPGPGTKFLSRTLHFRKAVRFGDTVTATVKVTGKSAADHGVTFDCTAVNQHGDLVMDGDHPGRPLAICFRNARAACGVHGVHCTRRAADGPPLRRFAAWLVMTPFMDAGGFRWLRRVFEAAPAECHKILILRDSDRYAVELGVEHADWLRGLQVSVHDYYLSHDAASGRQLTIETFHAKLVVADETVAYVGSANFLSSSEGLCLETGFLVEGAAASDVARLVDAVLRVSRVL